MRHENSVFHGLSKHIPWAVFDRLVDEHGADRRIRRLPTRSQLMALLYGQLSGAASLREIEAGLSSHRARLYHLGAQAPARSTLADANAVRPHQVFAGLFAHMIGQASRGLRKRVGEAVRLIDSTGLRLSGLSGWASFSAGVCGAKLHVVYDPQADRPLYFAVTPARSTTSPPPRRCRSRPAPPMCSTSAITITAGGRSSIRPAAASSPASRRAPGSAGARSGRWRTAD